MRSWLSEIGEHEVIEVAKQIGMESKRLRSYGPCLSCRAVSRSDADRRGPVGLSSNGKGWRCWKCNLSGDLADLVSLKVCGKKIKETTKDEKAQVRDRAYSMGLCSAINGSSMPSVLNVSQVISKKAPDPKPTERVKPDTGPFRWSNNLADECMNNLFLSDGKETLDYLVFGRRFNEEIIREFGLGVLLIRNSGGAIMEQWVSIPLRDDIGRIINIRFRRTPTPCPCGGSRGSCTRCGGSGTVKKAYRVCAGRPLPLYGAHLLSADHKSDIIITEGELDVIAMHHYGFDKNVVSGTSGAGANWPDEWLDKLEPYKHFTIVYDDDEAGKSGALKLATKLGTYRTAMADLPFNDPGECLSEGVGIEEISRCLDLATSLCGVTLRKVNEYEEDIERLINSPEELIGRPLGSEKLDRVIGGMRPGLWVVTGETGHGKTTWATWICREQAMLHVPVMLTSFEQRPIGTVQKLLRSQMGGDFMKATPEARRESLYELGQLPIFIMDHYGETTRDQVVDAIRYSVRRHNVKVALIDHLGFLTRGAGDKERQVIEEVVRDLALIAINDGVTIILICHPNRTFASQQRRVKISDLKGASAIEQDAHVGLVVERQAPRAERGFPAAKVYVDKVRSEFGSPGAHVIMPFDPLACIYADTWDETPSGKAGLRPIVPG